MRFILEKKKVEKKIRGKRNATRVRAGAQNLLPPWGSKETRYRRGGRCDIPLRRWEQVELVNGGQRGARAIFSRSTEELEKLALK